jgi:hypothetical protein
MTSTRSPMHLSMTAKGCTRKEVAIFCSLITITIWKGSLFFIPQGGGTPLVWFCHVYYLSVSVFLCNARTYVVVYLSLIYILNVMHNCTSLTLCNSLAVCLFGWCDTDTTSVVVSLVICHLTFVPPSSIRLSKFSLEFLDSTWRFCYFLCHFICHLSPF